MTGSEIIQDLLKKIEDAIDGFQASIPAVQQDSFARITKLVKDMDIRGDQLAATTKNVKAIGQLKAELEKAVLSVPYLDKVSEFLKAFNTVSDLQASYFKTIVDDFSIPKVLQAVKEQAVDATIEGLTEAGMRANVIEGATDILRTNITTGGKFSDLMDQMRDFIIGSPKVPGAMLRYTQQLTTDAINQYSAQYNQIVTDDLGLDWFQYVGSIIKTSRPLCKALVDKKWIHRSEIEDIIQGDFPEFKQQGGRLDARTGLPAGMIPGTNKYNFPIYRGGYNCGHQLVPVSAAAVPAFLKAKFAK
jgi:hypothetical protein